MNKVAGYGRGAGIALALLLSPAIVALGVPFGYGIVGDLVASPWLAPLALGAAAAIGGNAWRRRLAYAAAAKSIT
jgi:hypothetical protein